MSTVNLDDLVAARAWLHTLTDRAVARVHNTPDDAPRHDWHQIDALLGRINRLRVDSRALINEWRAAQRWPG